MTGAGFGGCTVSIVRNESVGNFIENVTKGYEEVYEFIKNIDENEVVLIDTSKVNYAIYNNIPSNVQKIEERNPSILFKSIKNEIELKNIRKLNGIAGFPKSNESDADCFNTGHSSTSISAVLGMARARDLQGKKNSCIAVIGDGALTGGMALEALNDAGCSNCNLTVILNDNEMSIAKNIGGINQFLSTLRTKKLYTRTNKLIKNKLNKLPVVGNKLVRIIQRFKRACKQLVIRGMYFEDIGFTYLGPVDGHNIEKLESILKLSKEIEGPVLIHVLTKKGKGYKIAEKSPDRFHATSPFNIETGELKKEKKADYSKIFGEKLVKLARENEKIVAVTASMKDGTGLREFQKEFPKRFFDVGIAEQHAITMAKEGMIPVIPIYSSFYQRAYDQVIHDVAMQNLPVIMCVDRAGCVGADGETHQGTLDMAFFRLVPNLTIMAPKDFKELEDMMEFAEIIPVSAWTGENVDELITTMFSYLEEGPAFYDEDTITDQPVRQIVAELIREKALRLLSDEIPHGIAVAIDQMKNRPGKRNLIDIDATIICERSSHKGIIIGKQGSMLKRIGTDARREIEEFLQAKVNLRLWVKVKKDWRDSDFLLKNFGYKDKD